MIKYIKSILIIILGMLTLLSCGFKPINKKDGKLIYFNKITISGEKRISYILKNNILLISDQNSKNKYNVRIEVQKKKNIKIKDSTGKVTRYDLAITINLELVDLNNNSKIERTFIKNGNYDVASIYSDTISNENNATKNIIQQLSEEINNFITLTMRDK